MTATVPRVGGHALLREGSAFNLNRDWLGPSTRSGFGFCECGDKSTCLPSTAARRRWHKQHKAEVLAAQQRHLSEADWQRRVLDFARWHGWRAVHIRSVRVGTRWVTPYEGDVGLPDLILARRGVVLLVELKRDIGAEWQPGQREWLAALAGHGRLWKPADWATVQRELA